MDIDVVEFKSFQKNTLQGFLTVRIIEMDMIVTDLTVHAQNDKRWIGLPGKPQLDRDGKVITSGGKAQYVNILKFASRQASDAFRDAVLKAFDQYQKRAA